MRDISWLLFLSSRQSLRPQLCLHTLPGYVTQCPTDKFPGRESEYEMFVLFTSYLWHCLLAVQQAAQIELQSVPSTRGNVFQQQVTKKPMKPSTGLQVSLMLCYTALLKTVCIWCVFLLVWCCANSLASTIVVLSPECSSSRPVLMSAAGHWGAFVSFLRQTMQFKPASGM